jgi:hypothetical protein
MTDFRFGKKIHSKGGIMLLSFLILGVILLAIGNIKNRLELEENGYSLEDQERGLE